MMLTDDTRDLITANWCCDPLMGHSRGLGRCQQKYQYCATHTPKTGAVVSHEWLHRCPRVGRGVFTSIWRIRLSSLSLRCVLQARATDVELGSCDSLVDWLVGFYHQWGNGVAAGVRAALGILSHSSFLEDDDAEHAIPRPLFSTSFVIRRAATQYTAKLRHIVAT
eukprot:scaffold267753_cov38-Tisochrysis_lutea.AAC.2